MVAAQGTTPLDRVPAPLLVFTAMGAIQLGAAAAVGAVFERIGPTATMSARLGFAGLVLALLARDGVRQALRGDRRLVVAMAALLVAMNLTFYQAIERLPLGVATAVAMLGPIVVALGRSRGVVEIACAVTAGAGVALVTDADWGGASGVGLGWALANAVCFGTYVVLGERFGRALPGAGGVALAMGLGGIATLPIAVGVAGSALAEPSTLALCLLLGALIGTSITLEINALRRMPARAFGILLCFEPVLAALVGWVTLGQELSALQLLGIAAVVIAGIGATAFARPVPIPE